MKQTPKPLQTQKATQSPSSLVARLKTLHPHKEKTDFHLVVEVFRFCLRETPQPASNAYQTPTPKQAPPPSPLEEEV